jgi:SPP1 gp7 family putative phage head morphogenesis protein
VRDLRAVVRAIGAKYLRELAPLLETRITVDGGAYVRLDAQTLANKLNVLGVEVEAAIGPTVGPLFDRMSRGVSKTNARGQALFGIRTPTKGVAGIVTASETGIARDIAAARDRNIRFVENAHRAYAAQVREIFDDPDNLGKRVEDLRDLLRERAAVSESRAELIARDQTLKLNGQITATRQMRAGVERYTWSTSLDERVRPEHAALEGQSFSWLEPPEVGHPGQDFQCRCIAVPSVDELDDVFA